MNKVKILVFIAFAAMLAACGSDDGSPPSLRNTNIGFISPFDTLKAEFDSEIVNINEQNISFGTNIRMLSDGKKSSRILFIGNGSTPGGWHSFGDGLKDEPIIFKNLENKDGYVTASTELKFSTHPIYDIEPNDSEAEAYDLNSFLNTSARKVSFAGILEHKFEYNSDGDILSVTRDVADFYKLELKEAETIFITASSHTAPFKVRFYGECPRQKSGCLDDTLTITKEKNDTLSKPIPAGHWPEGATIGSKVVFYIKTSASDVGIESPTNPYILEVGIK